jgi:Glycosyltransferase family 87
MMERNTHWLNERRLSHYPRIILTLFIAIAVVWVVLSKHMIDIKGKPLGYDFITFWGASHLGLTGHPADAYDIRLISDAEKIAVPRLNSLFVWYYPPAFYLVILPLAFLPYLVAYLSFILATLACYVVLLYRVVRNKTAWCYLAAFSGLWMNFFHGQNAFLTASLAGAALMCLPRRPILAGVLVGLLAIKPHLALLFPVALIAIGAWSTLITAAVTAILFTAIGTAVLGVGTLKACVASLGFARHFLETGLLPWAKMPTVFAFGRLLGLPVAGAYAVHAVVAVGATLVVWRVWRHCQDWQLRGAALMTATFLISPYLFDYDLAWLAFPIAWLALGGLRDGWLRGDREVLVAAWLLPLLMSPIVKAVPIQIGPWVLGALLAVIVRRAARSPAARGPVANEESADRGETVQLGRALNDHPVTP